MVEEEIKFKSEMRRVLEQRGIPEAMKAYMRSEILKFVNSKKSGPRQPIDLQKRLLCTLIVDYLSNSGFDYTCSVFVPECKVAGDLLTNAEVCQILKLPTTFEPGTPLLTQIMKDYEHYIKQPNMMSSYAQTEETQPVSNLEERLRAVDSEYYQRTKTDPQTLEERMAKYQRECEIRMRDEISREVRRIRDMEISAMRIEESSKYRDLLQKNRDENERMWKEKLESLKIREKELHERIAIKERDIEQKEFNFRQQTIKDRENIKDKEESQVKAVQLELQSIRLQKEQWESRRGELDREKSELDAIKQQLAGKADEDFRGYKREYDRQYEDERQRQSEERIKIQEERRRIEFEKSQIEMIEAQMTTLKEEVTATKSENLSLKKNKEKSASQLIDQKEQLKMLSETGKHDLELVRSRDMQIESLHREVGLSKTALDSVKEQYKENDVYQKDMIKHLQSELESLRQVSRLRAQASEMVAAPVVAADPAFEFLQSSKNKWRELEKEQDMVKKAISDFSQPRSPSKEVVVVPSHVHLWKDPDATKRKLEVPNVFEQRVVTDTVNEVKSPSRDVPDPLSDVRLVSETIVAHPQAFAPQADQRQVAQPVAQPQTVQYQPEPQTIKQPVLQQSSPPKFDAFDPVPQVAKPLPISEPIQAAQKTPKPTSLPAVAETKTPRIEKTATSQESKTPVVTPKPAAGLVSPNTEERKQKSKDMMEAYTQQAKERANPQPIFQQSDESISEEISIEMPQSESEDFIF